MREEKYKPAGHGGFCAVTSESGKDFSTEISVYLTFTMPITAIRRGIFNTKIQKTFHVLLGKETYALMIIGWEANHNCGIHSLISISSMDRRANANFLEQMNAKLQ